MKADWQADLEELETAEDFLNYFQIEYDEELIKSKHIQLLRMLNKILENLPQPIRFLHYKRAVRVAYRQLSNGNELAFTPSACEGCTDCDD